MSEQKRATFNALIKFWKAAVKDQPNKTNKMILGKYQYELRLLDRQTSREMMK